MKRVTKILSSCEKSIKSLDHFNTFLRISIDTPEGRLFDAAREINNTPAATEETTLDPGTPEQAFLSSLQLIPYLTGFVSEAKLKRELLASIGRSLSYFTFSDAEWSTLYFTNLSPDEAPMRAAMQALSRLFSDKFGYGLKIEDGHAARCKDILHKRLEDARQFYITERGAWIQGFLDSLEDEISRISFLTFLRQRIYSKVFFDNDICIPVSPPTATLNWRIQREAAGEPLPKLLGVDGQPLHPLHFKHIFTYQQYCVPGVVEPHPGDCVVDAGAFVGDTTAWFAGMVGPSGHVHAFEPSPENAARGEENMRINGLDNVTFHNCALSSYDGNVAIKINLAWRSADRIEDDMEGDIKVRRLDDIDLQRKVDFIKSDTEGNEMALLRGAAATISRDAPICAICLYHKKDDFWEIPVCLKELRPDYKFWFRCEAEPVLFAQCPDPGT